MFYPIFKMSAHVDIYFLPNEIKNKIDAAHRLNEGAESPTQRANNLPFTVSNAHVAADEYKKLLRIAHTEISQLNSEVLQHTNHKTVNLIRGQKDGELEAILFHEQNRIEHRYKSLENDIITHCVNREKVKEILNSVPPIILAEFLIGINKMMETRDKTHFEWVIPPIAEKNELIQGVKHRFASIATKDKFHSVCESYAQSRDIDIQKNRDKGLWKKWKAIENAIKKDVVKQEHEIIRTAIENAYERAAKVLEAASDFCQKPHDGSPDYDAATIDGIVPLLDKRLEVYKTAVHDAGHRLLMELKAVSVINTHYDTYPCMTANTIVLLCIHSTTPFNHSTSLHCSEGSTLREYTIIYDLHCIDPCRQTTFLSTQL